MNNPAFDILSRAQHWLAQKHQVHLVTVVKTWGSSPRPLGSIMVINEIGAMAGSVSGGCIEEDLSLRIKQADFSDAATSRLCYGINAAESQRFGLPCGGRLEVVIQHRIDLVFVQTLLTYLQQRCRLSLHLSIDSGHSQIQLATPDQAFYYDGVSLQNVLGPAWRLLIIGANHLAYYVTQLALSLDFDVIVCDPREEATESWQGDPALLTQAMPDDTVLAMGDDPYSVVLTLAHDPRVDDLALMEALAMNFFYVGALGSHKNSAKRKQRLASLGITPSQLATLHGPVGLPIGSNQPAEIALAIMTDIVAKRNAIRIVCHSRQTDSQQRQSLIA